MKRLWRKGTRVMVWYDSSYKPYSGWKKAVYLRPAVRRGYHFVRESTQSGGYTHSVPAKSIRRRTREEMKR